jgi:hypothetical protein
LIFPASKDSAAFKARANNAAWNAVALRVGNGRVRVFDLGITSTSDTIEALLLGACFFWPAALLLWEFARHPFATVSKVRQRLPISTLVSLVTGRWLKSASLRIEGETLVLLGLIVDDVSAAFDVSFVDFYKGSDLAEDVENKRRRREKMRGSLQTVGRLRAQVASRRRSLSGDIRPSRSLLAHANSRSRLPLERVSTCGVGFLGTI